MGCFLPEKWNCVKERGSSAAEIILEWGSFTEIRGLCGEHENCVMRSYELRASKDELRDWNWRCWRIITTRTSGRRVRKYRTYTENAICNCSGNSEFCVNQRAIKRCAYTLQFRDMTEKWRLHAKCFFIFSVHAYIIRLLFCNFRIKIRIYKFE